MARLPRLVRAGLPHQILQAGHNGQALVRDDEDRLMWRAILSDVARTHEVSVHAWVLLDDVFHLVVTPTRAEGLSRFMQDFGRRYVGHFNRRHSRSGTLWNGRFRAGLVQPGQPLLQVMQVVETRPQRALDLEAPQDWPWSSLAHHVGGPTDALITEPPAFWAEGNTPFDREAAYRRRIELGLDPATVAGIESCARRGLPWGTPTFVQALEAEEGRALSPRPRGRPRKGIARPSKD